VDALQDEGYEVAIATSVSQVKAAIETIPDLDLAILDVMIPLQRTRPSRYCCNPSVSWAGSLSLGRYCDTMSFHEVVPLTMGEGTTRTTG
jgi:CheY-like chemotaxis protein